MDIQDLDDVKEELNFCIEAWSDYHSIYFSEEQQAELTEDIIDCLKPILIEIHKLIIISEQEGN